MFAKHLKITQLSEKSIELQITDDSDVVTTTSTVAGFKATANEDIIAISKMYDSHVEDVVSDGSSIVVNKEDLEIVLLDGTVISGESASKMVSSINDFSLNF